MLITNFKLEAYLASEQESIEEFLSLCEEAVQYITTNDQIQFKLKSALHELLTNALEHGYNSHSGKVSVSMSRDENSITFEVSDEGEGLDPSSIDINKTLNNIDEASSRGWGLLITNKLSRTMSILPNSPKGTRISITIPV